MARCDAFGKQDDALALHQKGDVISVSGVLQARQWTGQDGSAKSDYTMVADGVVSARTARPGTGNRSEKKRCGASEAQPSTPPARNNDLNDDEPLF